MSDAINLPDVRAKHAAWLRGKPDGQRADLVGANLREADLSRANLFEANLILAGQDTRGWKLEPPTQEDSCG